MCGWCSRPYATWYQLYAKASNCEFGRSSVGFPAKSFRLVAGLAVEPRKIEAIRTWARPVPCTDAARCGASSASTITTASL